MSFFFILLGQVTYSENKRMEEKEKAYARKFKKRKTNL